MLVNVSMCDGRTGREGVFVNEKYKAEIKQLLSFINNEEYLCKIYTMAKYYAKNELASMYGTAGEGEQNE